LLADIHADSLGWGRQTTVGLSITAIFSVVVGCFLETLEMRPALLYGDKQSVVSLPKRMSGMTLNDLEWLFRVKFSFRAGLADSDYATFEK